MQFTHIRDGARRLAVAVSTAESLAGIYEFPVDGTASIAVQPPAGGSVFIEYSCSSIDSIRDGDGLFIAAAGFGTLGTVSAPEINTVPSTITALRVTASAAGARVEVAQ